MVEIIAAMAGEPRVSGAYGSVLLVLGGALAWATGGPGFAVGTSSSSP